MMDGVELMAVSLGLSVGVAALGLAGGALVERLTDDPGLRDRMWGAALLLPLLPPLATGLLLMTPAPVQEAVMRGAPLPAILTPVAAATEAAPVAAAPTLDGGLIAMGVIVAAGLLALLRLSVLILRARRLARLMRNGGAMDAALLDDVAAAARGRRRGRRPVTPSPWAERGSRPAAPTPNP
ncbi:MAG: hypothetical protein EON85_13665 [Brevundimonas sp.]|nr:MAG: hypothetical protein EON85_13665 [Brevundimonas sp.]